MKSQINKNEFMRARILYEDAGKLMHLGKYKSAKTSLKKALVFLQKDSMQTLMLAKAYIRMADIEAQLEAPESEKYYCNMALHTLQNVHADPELESSIQKRLEALESL